MRVFLSVVLVLAMATGVSPPAGVTPSAPDTPAGHALVGWLRAFDSGDRATFLAFLTSSYPSGVKRIDDDMQFRQMTGGFVVREIVTSAPTRLVAMVEDQNNEQFATMTVVTESAAPYVIDRVSIRATATPPEFAAPAMSQSELLAALGSRVEAEISSGGFAGAVLVAKDGQPVFARAYGLADREHDIANTLETRFRMGSMNKMFTAVATLQLVAAGKINLDAPLGTYLPDYPNKDVATQVTIAELLDHTGGTGDIFGPEFDAHRLELRSLQDYEKLYGSRGPAFTPGSKWDYSNYGFVLLGLVIEKVSGQSYYDYVRAHVYAPAGMTSTGSEPENAAVADRSTGYTLDSNGKLVPNTDTLPYRGTPAGGGYSTVGDLLKFANALQQNRLLDARYTEILTVGKVDTPNGSRYAYGFEDQRFNGVRCFGHSGGAPGMNGELEVCPANGYVVAVLANLDPPAASRIADFVTARLPKT
ncbi:MAG: serine hydrolase domain-containing protein [Candidatus Cybelea sp.]